MQYGSLNSIQILLLVRNVELVSSLYDSQQPRSQIFLLLVLRTRERWERETREGTLGTR